MMISNHIKCNNLFNLIKHSPKIGSISRKLLFNLLKISRIVTSWKLIPFHPQMQIEMIHTLICHLKSVLHHNNKSHKKYRILSQVEYPVF